MAVEGLGFAPPSPHGSTPGMAVARCEQCHVEQQTEQLFVPTEFEGRPQDLRAGARAHAEAPPVMPHRLFMHEQCAACHAGPAAREELRTTHPERASCLQCHLEVRATSAFVR
jgi:cytochrome c-type protein NapB